MNVYREFKRQNPGVKKTAKQTGESSNNYAALMLADKAEQTARACTEIGKLEKAMYYYSKAYNWYADAKNTKCVAIQSEIVGLARVMIPPKT